MPMARWLAGRYGRKAVYQMSIAVFALGLVLATRATTPMQFIAARIVQGGASGPLAPLSMAILLDMLPPARHARISLVWRRDRAARHPQRSQHRRLAQRISRLALDLLSQPADGGLHLPGDGALASGEAGRAESSVRLLRPDDILVRHDRVADAARPRRAHGVVQLGRDLGGGGCLGAGFLPLSRARPDHEGAFPQQGVVQGPQLRPFGDHVLRVRLRPAADHGFDVADAGRIAQLPGRHHRLHGNSAQRRAGGGVDPDEHAFRRGSTTGCSWPAAWRSSSTPIGGCSAIRPRWTGGRLSSQA